MPHARCSHCGKRRTLARKPDEYIRPPRCGRCNGNTWRLDNYRRTRERGRGAPKPCHPGRGGCNGYSFPHRRGSKFCHHNHNISDEELQARDQWA